VRIPFQLHRRIPLLRRPFYQRDQLIRERDELATELRESQAKLQRATSEFCPRPTGIRYAVGEERVRPSGDEICSFGKFIDKWLAGIDYEARYWDGFIGAKGGLQSQDYERRTMPAPPFCYGHIPDLPAWPPTVLDVGAGPISNAGIRTPAGDVNLVACDPLAPIYDAILRKHNVVPYVRSEFAIVERLTERYGANRFDAVLMQNALDHAFYAVDGLLELFNVAKIGGQVLLLHAGNEAEFESYSGFHQWNIDAEGDCLIFWRQDTRVVINDLLRDSATITNEVSLLDPSIWPDRKWIRTKIVKHKASEARARTHLSIYDEVIAGIAYKAMSPTFRGIGAEPATPDNMVTGGTL
jgi:hypothetical protein